MVDAFFGKKNKQWVVKVTPHRIPRNAGGASLNTPNGEDLV